MRDKTLTLALILIGTSVSFFHPNFAIGLVDTAQYDVRLPIPSKFTPRTDLRSAYEAILKGNYPAFHRLLNTKQLRKSTDEETLFLAALSALGERELEEATRVAHLMLKKRSSDSDAVSLLAYIQRSRKDYKKALQYFNEALWFDNFSLYHNAQVRSDFAALLLAEEREVEAEEQYRKAVKQGPSHPDGWLGLSNLLLQNGNINEAKSLLQQAPPGVQDTPDIQLALAETLIRGQSSLFGKSDAKEALRLVKQALEKLDPKERAEHDRFGIVIKTFTMNKMFNEARTELVAAIQNFPHDERVLALQKQLDLEEEAVKVFTSQGLDEKGHEASSSRRKNKRSNSLTAPKQ